MEGKAGYPNTSSETFGIAHLRVEYTSLASFAKRNLKLKPHYHRIVIRMGACPVSIDLHAQHLDSELPDPDFSIHPNPSLAQLLKSPGGAAVAF